ncbi:lactosylceramide 1,3-N-acetyl-beta-D-glucosaminyltransferase A-like isoform X1 [Ciona intestinalis]
MKKFSYLRRTRITKRGYDVTVTVLFKIFLAFLFGVVIGFNIKDLMIRTCSSIAPRKPISYGVAKLDLMLSPKFTELPEKFLTNIPPENATFAFTLRPWKYVARHKTNKSQYFMTFLVKSAAWLSLRRFFVRKTWGSVDTINGHRFGLIFIVGSTTNEEQQKLLEQENAMYGDILQCDVIDDYINLPRKVLSAFQWVTYEGGNISDYYVTTDDDCSINIPTSYDYFVTNKTQKLEYLHCGYIYDKDNKPVRNPKSKYGMPPSIYPYAAYPTFCHGGMTVMSYTILRDLYMTSQVTNYANFHLEDVLITGILREKKYNSSKMVVPKGYNGWGGSIRRNELLVWHMGTARRLDVAFEARWRRICSGLRILFVDDTLFGKQPSAAWLNATLRGVPSLPGKTLTETMFEFGGKWKQLRRSRVGAKEVVVRTVAEEKEEEKHVE